MVKNIFLALLILALSLIDLHGKEREVLRDIEGIYFGKEAKKENLFLPESSNVLEWTGLVFIKFYQTFISSQDRPACVFEPTCSRYTEMAIKKYGFIKGVIMGADRLQRCHSGAFGHYPVDEKSGRNYDPLP